MQTATNLFFRDDTLLGVCEGVGSEFGFNANYLRVGLASLLLWNAVAVIGGYLVLGVVLALSRWLWPAQPLMTFQPDLSPAGTDVAAPVLAGAA